MDVNERLKELTKRRGWTMYRLSKESGVAWSTVRNMFERNTLPTIPTLEALCAGLHMTMDEFFVEDEWAGLTAENKALLRQWSQLSAKDKAIVLSLIQSLSSK